MRGVVLNKVPGLVPTNTLHVRHFVPELDAVELVGVLEQLGPEGGGDELRAPRQLVDDVRHALAVRRVQGLRSNASCQTEPKYTASKQSCWDSVQLTGRLLSWRFEIQGNFQVFKATF